MPQMGFDMQEGTVVRWLKSEGSEVREGEAIAEIETDKAVVEFQSYSSGVLRRILVPEGATVPVGRAIAIVGAAEEELPELAISKSPPAVPAPTAAPSPEKTQASVGVAPPPSAREVRASPVARRLAADRGVDLSSIKGTGPSGMITKDDVLAVASSPVAETAAALAPSPPGSSPAAAGAAPASAPDRVLLSRMRQQIARVTFRSKQEKPHFYVTCDVDMTKAMDLRRQINQVLEPEGVRITVNDLIIKACVGALQKYPRFNAFFHEDGIQVNPQINVGVAIAEEEGLIVPAIMDCAKRSLRDIAIASKDLAERAKSGTLRAQEYTGGTFAISNLGMFDVTSFIAIIHPPQSAVLAVGTVAKRPVVREDHVVVAEMMTATLSADHRIVDGAEGARFVVEVKRLLETPLSLLA